MSTAKTTVSSSKPKCGIVMPISAIDDLTEAHWLEVNDILSDAISSAGFEPNLVSTAEEVGIIQKTIIHNLYENPVVVCDVSAKNPNVMFELGMRLAFDRPTIIVKDDKTSYTFDTAQIEHLGYPRDLRFNQIVQFKKKLTEKVKNTHNKAVNDPDYTTFLKHFGEFKVAKIDQTEVSGQEFIIDEIRSLKQSILTLQNSARRSGVSEYDYSAGTSFREVPGNYYVNLSSMTPTRRVKLISELEAEFPEVKYYMGGDVLRLFVPGVWPEDQNSQLRKFLSKLGRQVWELESEDQMKVQNVVKTSKTSKA